VAKKNVVVVEDVMKALKERRRINRIPLKDIIIYEGGKEVEILEWVKEHFEFTGLNNIDFIASGMYKVKEDKETYLKSKKYKNERG